MSERSPKLHQEWRAEGAPPRGAFTSRGLAWGAEAAAQPAPLGPEFQVSSAAAGEQVQPAVATDNRGNFVVAWQSQARDGSASRVVARRFGPDGAPLGGDFAVDAGAAGCQRY